MRKIFIFIFLIAGNYIYSQNGIITGKIIDGRNTETIPGVNIALDSSRGTVSDLNGLFRIEVKEGKHQVTFSFIGYTPVKRSVSISKGETKFLNIQLNEESKLLNTVVVSGSAFEKRVMDEIVSIDVIKPYLIQNNVVTDISETIEKVPGVKITDGQTSIRSGSGFSYGTGSRVQVVVDGQSFISPDLGEVKWKLVPTENVEQVEVIKGASSVLYGSSSMNGVINILTGWPGIEPETNIKFYQGFYLYPKRDELAWWGRESEGVHIPSYTGLSILHKQKVKQFDFVVGANASALSSYLKDIDDYRFGAYVKVRYRHPKNKGLSFGLSGNILYDQVRRFMFYENAYEGGYISTSGSSAPDINLIISLNPYMNYFAPNGDKHILKLMYFNVITIKLDKYNNRPENTPANSFILSYQLQKKLRKNIIWTSGADISYGWVKNNYFFEGFVPKTLYGALFSQLEHKLGKFTFITGLRYELYGLTGIRGINPEIYGTVDFNTIIEPSQPILRIGLNYKAAKNTSLRLSFGQAYRFPAISERFLNGSIGSLHIFPNPYLQPENGWNLEAGIKQEINIHSWKGYADLAIFWTEYNNFINYTFGKYREGESNELDNYGFKAINISRARITGCELSLVGEGSIANIPVRIMGGYTFTYPGDLDSDTSQRHIGHYLFNLFESIGGIDTNHVNSILTYRNRHTLRFDLEVDIKRFTLGVTLNYNSSVERVDEYYALFNLIVDGIKNYTHEYNKGTLLLDLRLSYRIKDKARLMLVVKNLTNQEYSDRPGLIGPPRNISVQFNIKL